MSNRELINARRLAGKVDTLFVCSVFRVALFYEEEATLQSTCVSFAGSLAHVVCTADIRRLERVLRPQRRIDAGRAQLVDVDVSCAVLVLGGAGARRVLVV